MHPYPADDVDRIIAEEIIRAEETGVWFRPAAQTRVTTLLMGSLCAACSVPAAREAVVAVAAAETMLLGLCGKSPRMLTFDGADYIALVRCLLTCDSALGLVLAAHDAWPSAEGLGGPHDKLRSKLDELRSAWTRLRANVQSINRSGKRVGIHSSLFVQMHDALLLGYSAFLTLEENTALNAQLAIVFTRMHELDEACIGAPPARPS